jgi:hypothetical protein
MASKKAVSNMVRFIEHFSKVTLRISTLDKTGALLSRCSGFLYKLPATPVPIVITAGHDLPQEGSFIETAIIKNDKMLMINAGKFNVFYNHEDIDYAYSTLPKELYKNDIKAFENIAVTIYQHEFVKAVKAEAYGFAVVNNYEFVTNHAGGFFVPSYYCYEVGLELVKQDEHLNYFKPTEFKGDDYYRGASGSPIADPEGQITSILIGGTPDFLLRAFRLDNIEPILP